MSSDSNPDRDSFQQFLASAFAVQESQMDSQFLSSMLEVQRLVTRGELDVEGVMTLIVHSARDVAGAAGVAIGWLEGDQLLCRAGSGCFAEHLGSHVAASLTVSSKTKASREILRVENAQTDTRIEGAICRQFGAESLLILPIYRERNLAGVFEVLFSEPHAFHEDEVRAYRLMVGLIEAAMHPTGQIEWKEDLKSERTATPPAMANVTAHGGRFLQNYAAMTSSHAIFEHCGAALAKVRGSPVFRQPGLLARRMVQRATEVISNKPLRSLALAAVATGFGLTFWIANGGRGPASPSGPSAIPGSTAIKSFQPVNPRPAEGPSTGQPAPVPVKQARLETARARRVGAGQNKIDYIGDDVTVRHFSYKPARQRMGAGASRVAYIGEDVTVRYFTPKPAVESESR